ncbi:winged helix-turn-helix transcriptional regulator [Brevundimonas sp. VNH65]|uniref:winged helix-turn-helix transcriptional regulator n=1 Tax=Brevundimonas sp. VNH65 TaxID=3400917 RepID=UPI003C04FAF7
MKLEKLTKEAGGRSGRRYHDACGAAHGLDLVGERWALLVVRELMFGPRRFGDLKGDLCGISANVLTQRLEGLEAAGIVRRRKLPPPASVQVYELTGWGYEAQPVFEVLGRWAARSPQHDPSLPISAVSVMMSLRTMFDADAWRASGGEELDVGFVFGEQAFRARIADDELSNVRVEGEAALADCAVVFVGAPVAVPQFVYGKRPLAEMEAEGSLAVTGDRAATDRFQTWFGLPEKAGA